MSNKSQRKKLAKQIREHGISSVQFKPELVYGVQLPPGAKLPKMPVPVAYVESEPRQSVSFFGQAFEPKDRVQVFPTVVSDDQE